MLTDPALLAHVAAEQLRLYEPPKGFVVRRQRKLLLTPDIHDALFADPWKQAAGETPSDARSRRRQQHAILGRYLNGDVFTPNHQVKVLRPTHPDFADIIEFRSGPPRPQTRLFALVYEPGTWICCGFYLRDELGDRNDPRWLAAAQETQAKWRALFPNRAPKSAPWPCDTTQKMRALLDD